MTGFYLVVAVASLMLAITGAALMIRRYLYLRHRFIPQEKMFWTGVAFLLAVTGYGLIESIYQDAEGGPRVLLLAAALVWVDYSLLKPFTPDR